MELQQLLEALRPVPAVSAIEVDIGADLRIVFRRLRGPLSSSGDRIALPGYRSSPAEVRGVARGSCLARRPMPLSSAETGVSAGVDKEMGGGFTIEYSRPPRGRTW